jgi:hypothetical protein
MTRGEEEGCEEEGRARCEGALGHGRNESSQREGTDSFAANTIVAFNLGVEFRGAGWAGKVKDASGLEARWRGRFNKFSTAISEEFLQPERLKLSY